MSGGFRLDVSELADLANDLATAAGVVGPVAVAVQRKYGMLVVAEAKQLAPVRTGALRRSIQIGSGSEAARTGLTGVTIEADTSGETGRNYAGFVEFGTRFMAPRPFMRPALRKYAKAYREELVSTAANLIGGKGRARKAIRGQSIFRGESSFGLSKAIARGGYGR